MTGFDIHDKVPLHRKRQTYNRFYKQKYDIKESLSSRHFQINGASYHVHQKKRRASQAGSLMVETAVILPILACFIVSLLFLFRVLQVQECVEEALQYSARLTAVTCYGDSPESQTSEAAFLAQAELAFEKQLKQTRCPMGFVRHNLSLLKSDFKGNDVTLCASYQMVPPVRLFFLPNLQMNQSVCSRKWVGDVDLTKEGDTSDDIWVYITPNGTAYHKSRRCPYLDLSIHAVSRRQADSERNESGGRYHRCRECAGDSETVFLTDYGRYYHSSLNCSALKRTIQMVRLSETEGRHACPKCARNTHTDEGFKEDGG